MNVSELIRLAVKMNEQSADQKIEILQKQVEELRKLVLSLVREKETVPKSNVWCRRCGRRGHWTLSCNAPTDINGNRLGDDSDYESE
jgi:hypothetical protein